MSDRKRPPNDWEGAVDRAIRDAIERGKFENLAGRGKPLDLGENPFTPADMQAAFKLLKDAGVTLDWIEEGKEILAERQKLTDLLKREARSQSERRSKQASLTLDKIIAEHQHLEQQRDRTIAEFRDRAKGLNRKIDNYNLQVPTSRLQQRRVPMEEEIESFLEACRLRKRQARQPASFDIH